MKGLALYLTLSLSLIAQASTQRDIERLENNVNKRFEDLQRSGDKRFEDLQRYLERSQTQMMWFIGVLVGACTAFMTYIFIRVQRQSVELSRLIAALERDPKLRRQLHDLLQG